MHKGLNLLLGSTAGAILVTIGIALLSPLLSQELRQHLAKHYEEALLAGRQAAAEKRAQLERELHEMQQDKS